MSVLDNDFSLVELLDVEGFRELCRGFGELYGIGIKVVDADGNKISDLRVSSGDHCGYLFSIHSTRVMCTSLVSSIKEQQLDPRQSVPVAIDCFSGLRYKVLPIVHQGKLLGRIIFGPYRPDGLNEPPEDLLNNEPRIEEERLSGYLKQIPAARDTVADEIVDHIANVLRVVVHSSYRVFLTSQVHIASTQEAFEEIRTKNEELRDLNVQLKELDRMKSNFLATVSHELRTPLTSVIGYSEMLLEGLAGQVNDGQKEYIETILEKGESLLHLIGQVLDLAKIESGNSIISKSEVSASELVSLSISDVAPQAQKKDLIIDTAVNDDIPPILVDRDKIRRAVTNLLSNAVKFTPEGGKVTVRAQMREIGPESDAFSRFDDAQNNQLLLEVSDTGIGIPEESLARVFDSFYQVDNSETREYGGSGLGLAIVQNFARSHGGSVSVQSVIGEGSTFALLLPYSYDEADEMDASPEFLHPMDA